MTQEELERRLTWARWEVVRRSDAHWDLASVVEPVGHPVRLQVSDIGAWLRGAERVTCGSVAEWPAMHSALDRLRGDPDRVSVGEFTVGGLAPGLAMEVLEEGLGRLRASEARTWENPFTSESGTYCDCWYEGGIVVRYDRGEDEVWRARVVVAPTLEDAGRVVAREGDHESRLREVLGPPDTYDGVEVWPLRWTDLLGVQVFWSGGRRARAFMLGREWWPVTGPDRG